MENKKEIGFDKTIYNNFNDIAYGIRVVSFFKVKYGKTPGGW